MNARFVLFAAVLAALAATCAASPRPVVLWHGMGDHGTSAGMEMIQNMIKKTVPGIYTKSIVIGKDAMEDVVAGFIGNVWDQIDGVADMIRADPRLQNGFNMLTFSQGGQFARGLIQKYGHTLPPVYNLVTYGGQHQGVADVPNCVDADSPLCKFVAQMVDKGAYLPEVRDDIVQAQYLMDMLHYDDYLKYSQFIADINNQRPVKNETYKDNLLTLNNFVCILWLNDTVVVPRVSEHFGRYAVGSLTDTVSMFDTPLYQNDWIGIKKLYEAGRLILLETLGNHMTVNESLFINNVVIPYLDNDIATQL